jgi:general stress protein 26
MVGTDSVKSRNVASNDRVAMHWQVTENGDGVEIWGQATVVSDLETKRRLWKGVFDYDLDAFAPGGPDNSPTTAFMRIDIDRAVILRMYGAAGVERWQRS